MKSHRTGFGFSGFAGFLLLKNSVCDNDYYCLRFIAGYYLVKGAKNHSIIAGIRMSVVVFYGGKRKTVRIDPQALVQDVIVDVAKDFGLDPEKCQLKHQRTTLAKNQLFRFTNVPNNAQLELIVGSGPSSSSTAAGAGANPVAKIALSIPNGGSIQRTFDCTMTLRDMLNAIVRDGGASSDILTSSPELIYMRNSYAADKLDTTTLASLGLAGQSGRFMLKVGEAGTSASSVFPSSPLSLGAATVDSLLQAEAIVTGGLIAVVAADQQSQSTTPASPQLSSPKSDSSPLYSSAGPPPPTTTFTTVSTVKAPSSNQVIPDTERIVMEVRTPEAVLGDLLSNNFDAVSAPAIVTMTKYVCNILSNPEEPKFRTITTSNAVFSSKVGNLPAAVEFLLSIGFEAVAIGQGPPNLVFGSSQDISRLKSALKLLHKAMDGLGVPAEERPKVKVAAVAPPQPPVPFDPFKPAIIRNAPQVCVVPRVTLPVCN
jgi:hypothetical protein